MKRKENKLNEIRQSNQQKQQIIEKNKQQFEQKIMYEFDFRKFIYRSFVRHFPPYKLSLRHCVNRNWDMKNRQPQYCKYELIFRIVMEI